LAMIVVFEDAKFQGLRKFAIELVQARTAYRVSRKCPEPGRGYTVRDTQYAIRDNTLLPSPH
jgi:hypothetical protein